MDFLLLILFIEKKYLYINYKNLDKNLKTKYIYLKLLE